MGSIPSFFPQPQRRRLLFLLLGAGIAFYLLRLSYSAPRPFDRHPGSYLDTQTTVPNIPSTSIAPATPATAITVANAPASSRAKSPYCVAIFLGAYRDYQYGDDDDDDDSYFVGARTLVYQLLHAPATRFTHAIDTDPIPVIFLVTKDVSESKRRRLEADGASVIEIEPIEASWANGRYKQVLTKLRLFDPEILPYEKVFVMDTDMVITRPIDAIFQDEGSHFSSPDYNRTGADTEIAPLPPKYMFAASPESHDLDHPYPFLNLDPENQDFNVGCMLFSPSKEIYKYYLEILKHPNLFRHEFPEQDLLNYVHRLDGPMPWSSLHYSWHISCPNENDIKGKMAIIHAKFWFAGEKAMARQLAISCMSEMKKYWIGKEGAPNTQSNQ
ncbi:hypothetical protein N7533_000401 [Penicillium manginii]|jgi:alpha-N-acetylglucosamine transferase|uniref:uncharacterized protein n=1 Tax=Penicillium manginii TaxID=203109 RepID=UPI0025498A0F|nr:uncharacterized protein N7533_000401 [Penicillium manginii]KAJ5767818.1 hypothetical protein N7533_000401 [Penicillium manginii]